MSVTFLTNEDRTELEGLIEELKNNGPDGTVTDEQIADAVEDYFTEHPIEGKSGVYTLSEGETIDDAPSDADVVIDPYAEPEIPEGGVSDEQIADAVEDYFRENPNAGDVTKPVDPNDPAWSQWNGRLAFGVQKEIAPVPFKVNGQMLVDGMLMAHNNGNQKTNRWGFHVFEAYAKDNYSRMTMLLDKHASEASGKPSLEYYYYTGANHHATSYGNVKIGSDVAYHSFCFDRDKMTAYGEIDSKMPITLARISLANDINTAYETVSGADAAYEPETNHAENIRCLKYIALKNAENGAMFYDTDRNKAVMKINGLWCDIPFTVIADPLYEIFGQGGDPVYCTAISLSHDTLNFTTADSQTLIATVTPGDTTEKVTWTTSNGNVAKVSNGIVTPKSNGECVITATCGTKSASCSVHVDIETEIVANILDGINWEVGSVNASSGAAIPSATTAVVSDHVNISNYTGKRIVFFVDGEIGGQAQKVVFYDAGGSYISGLYSSTAWVTGGIPANAVTMRLGMRAATTKCAVYIDDALNLDGTNEQAGHVYAYASGQLTSSASYSTQKVEVKEHELLINNVTTLAFFDVNDEYISGLNDLKDQQTVSLPDGTKYVAFNYQTSVRNSVTAFYIADIAGECYR